MAAVMDEKFDCSEVDAALNAWARWAKSAFAGLGWSPVNIIARIIEFGLMGAGQSGMRTVEADAMCELVERAIRRLDETEQEVIVRTYLEHHAAQVTARRCGLTYQYYRNVLSRARRRIGDYLDGARTIV